MSQLHINDLPNEIFHRIFQELPEQDIKAAVLVCKAWNEIGEDPIFWARAIVRIESGRDIQKLDIYRFQMLEIVEVNCTGGNRLDNNSEGNTGGEVEEECNQVEEEGTKCKWTKFEMTELFKAIQKIPMVRRIVGKTCRKCISTVKPELLVNVLTILEKVSVGGPGDFWCLDLAREQLEFLFTALEAERPNTLKLEVWEFCDLSHLSPGLFASAISNVTEVDLCAYDVSHEQMMALLSEVTDGNRPMRKLQVSTVLTQTLDSDILANAFKRLEEVIIDVKVDISSEEVSAILNTVMDGESRLKRLILHDIDVADLVGVDQGLIKRAMEKVGFIFSVYDDCGSEEDFSEDYDDIIMDIKLLF